MNGAGPELEFGPRTIRFCVIDPDRFAGVMHPQDRRI